MAKLLTRRKFLIAGALVGGGIAIGYGLRDEKPANAALKATTGQGEFALNAYVKIDKEGQITIAIPQAEMGQGIFTALAMLVAEELEVSLDQITAEPAPIDPVYANVVALMDSLPFSDAHHKGEATIGAWGMKNVGEMLGLQATGGSTSVRNSWQPMQQAGATAREMLIAGAASKWGVSAKECEAKSGTIRHAASGKSAPYADIVEFAAKQPLPSNIPLKNKGNRRVIGTSQKRLDIPGKVDGSALFGVDIELPEMAYSAVKLSPVFGGTVASWDPEAIKSMPGFIKAVKFETGVAVIADSFWRAKKAVEALPVEFNDGEHRALSTQMVFDAYEKGLNSSDGRSYAESGDVLAEIGSNSNVVSARYKAPFLAHACMEPMNCTARVDDNSVEIWAPNQSPTLAAWFAEKVADVPAENVKVNSTFLGGGFGRRIEIDYVVMAVTIAKELPGRPVKLVWTRENDIQHDMYRPAAMADFKATLNNGGTINGWHTRLASPSVARSFTERLLPWAGADMPDNTTAEGAADIAYQFPHMLVEHFPTQIPVPVGFWRSVGHSYNGFFTESFMDEMAVAAKQDPIDFRLSHLGNHPDYSDVLKKLKQVSGWQKPLGENRGRGVALHESFGTIVGQVVEITMLDDQTIKIDKVYCVVDCGEVVNPDTVAAQMESAIIFGLTAALFGEITLKDGRVEQSNFPDYEMMQLAHCPDIEVHLAPSGRPLGGIGEPGTPPIAPALTNAIFNASKTRIRELPITKSGFSV
ncbi:xanthine dehydrogenase family protein molybdopterin-binding subunit [Sneathiella aquimaris]|uniref:xanthine dehydrogenase family protein molybdopterin-binding subunit n=1 Tax=Sneathiella aquimaris TaxID=2599305 RepID=UPI00146B4B74|nr:xanthine dehydrogenase family protein molybdopterin-binding subunit [Sneathiella aquimaris]